MLAPGKDRLAWQACCLKPQPHSHDAGRSWRLYGEPRATPANRLLLPLDQHAVYDKVPVVVVDRGHNARLDHTVVAQ